MNKTREVKLDPKKNDKITRFSITKEERERFESYQNIIAIKNIEMDGVKTLLFNHAISIRKRLNINEEDAPKGHERFMDFDPDTYEVLVIDRPVVEEKEAKEPIVNN